MLQHRQESLVTDEAAHAKQTMNIMRKLSLDVLYMTFCDVLALNFRPGNNGGVTPTVLTWKIPVTSVAVPKHQSKYSYWPYSKWVNKKHTSLTN